MNRFLVSLAVLTAALPVVAQDTLPRDVQGFVIRRDSCDQMRSEAPDAKEKLLKLCMGTDKELVQLKRKHAANSTIMQILNQFETSVEATAAMSIKVNSAHR
jgi:hypothetical protein